MEEVFEGHKILVVDDAASAIKDLIAVYRGLGLEVVATVHSGVEALEYLAANPQPHYVSIDIIMPDVDGVQLYHKIINQYKEVTCFFVSALCKDPRIAEAYSDEIRSEAFLAKPLESEALTLNLNQLKQEPLGSESETS